jgi:hypothetical protein
MLRLAAWVSPRRAGQLYVSVVRGVAAIAYQRRRDPTPKVFAKRRSSARRVRRIDQHRGDELCQFRLTHQGCQSILTGMDIEELSVNLSSDDPAIGLRASLALHRLAERVEANNVASARKKGWSWQQIGDALGVTRQSVHTKYNKESS